MSKQPNQMSSDYGPLTNLALKEILGKFFPGQKVSRWTGPNITAESGTYKLDWYAPDYDETDTYLTLYDDGMVQLYVDGETKEIKITPLHHRTWIDKMLKNQLPAEIAVFAVDFFKELKENK